MHINISSILILGIALVSTSSASPTIIKRGISDLPPSGHLAHCPDYKYSRPQIEDDIDKAIQLTPRKATKINGFPHEFGNNKKLKFNHACSGKKLWEYPILPVTGETTYAGGSSKLDRVVFAVKGDPDATKDPPKDGYYCGTMTHSGAPTGEFVRCPEKEL